MDHAICVAIGIRVEENAVYEAEDCGCSANSQREREYGRDGEAGRLSQLPCCISEILEQSVHGCPSLISKRLHGVDFSRPTRWDVSGQNCDDRQNECQ